MAEPLIAKLSDIATEAHTRIQRDFARIDPIVGVSRNMRTKGVPADVMTVDCLKTNKRIIIILHDEQPDIISYQFAYRDRDPAEGFQTMAFAEMTTDKLYQWIASYFSDSDVPMA